MVTEARLALLRVYAALDRVRPREHGERAVPLEDALARLGVDMTDLRSPEEELGALGKAVRAERESDESDRRPPIALVRVAETAMDVVDAVGRREEDQLDAALRIVAEQLVQEELLSTEEDVLRVADALRDRAAIDEAQDRWARFRGGARARSVDQLLKKELQAVLHHSCKDELPPIGDEFASKITTVLEVARDTHTLDQLAAACMPPNWGSCNDFFCSLTHLPERNAECPPTGADPPRSDADDWRTVYEEKVLVCPDGAFPDTFLLFTWSRTPRQVVLQYELAPRRQGEQPRLRIDEGSIQIDTLPTSYCVTTTKLLLFDDDLVASGGQTLGRYACELGWLDHSIAMFTGCADDLPNEPDRKTGSRVQGPDERLLGVVTRCQDHARHRAETVVQEADACLDDLRSGTRGVDEHFTRCAKNVTQWTAGDGARWVEGQLDYAVASIDLARDLVEKWRRARA